MRDLQIANCRYRTADVCVCVGNDRDNDDDYDERSEQKDTSSVRRSQVLAPPSPAREECKVHW